MDNNSQNHDSNNRDRDLYLNHLNKLSHKISKPIKRSSSTVDLPPIQSQPSNSHHQPPVYNINKSDFRDVVQRLTGSPVQDRFSTPAPPAPVQHSKPTSSRLQKIRPPPLPQIGNRGPDVLTGSQRQPFSPLPPLPTVHATAESPISAYMRLYQNSFNFAPPPLAHVTSSSSTPGSIQPRIVPPTSPLPFGCLSPGVVSHGLLFSPKEQAGFPQLPLSPTLPVSSPRQKGH